MLNFEKKNDTIIPESAFEEFEAKIADRQIPFHGYMMLHGKNILAEKYFDDYHEDSLHRMYSITKSFVALAVGILIRKGIVHYEDKIVDFFPEMLDENPHEWLLEMTIEDMLSMRTCHGDTTYKHKEYFHGDWTKSFFRVKPDHIPGTVFCYDTSSAQTLGALVEKLTGKDVLDFLREEAFDEIGFSKEAYIMKDPVGVGQGGSGMLSTLTDVAKVAYLFNHNGFLDGKELLPSDYIKRATDFQVSTSLQPTVDERCGYGYMIWKTRRPGFVFYGMGGQLAVCFPQYDFIYMTIADTIGNGAGLQIIYDCFYDTIYPYLEKQYGPVKTSISDEKHELAKNRSSLRYKFYENKFGFENLILDFQNNNICLESPNYNFVFNFKDNEWVSQTFPNTAYNSRCLVTWENQHLILNSFVTDEEHGHMSLDIAWKDDARVSIRFRCTNEPFFYGINGYASAYLD